MTQVDIKKHLLHTYGLKVKRLVVMRGGVMNDNYKISSDKGEFIFRDSNRTSFETVHFEFDVLSHLESLNFFSPHIHISLSGRGVVLFKKKPSVLYTYIKGESIKKITKNLLGKIGRAIGRFHTLVADFDIKVHKESWEPHFLIRLVEVGEDLFTRKGFPDAKDLFDFLREEMGKFSFPNLPSGVTHQDIKPENILVHKGQITGFIDFDNSFYGAYVHDITTTAIWTCFTKYKLDKVKLNALLCGYEKERKLTSLEKKVFNDALKWRLLREMFIGPYVTVKKTPKTQERLTYFKKLYSNFL